MLIIIVLRILWNKMADNVLRYFGYETFWTFDSTPSPPPQLELLIENSEFIVFGRIGLTAKIFANFRKGKKSITGF